MRITKLVSIAFICIFLSACISSLLIGNQLQSKLMWSFLKPLVGFDPNEVDLFETPMIKDRMTALLGDKYEPTMKLLRTAQEIQQEGALFYVASRYAPAQVQSITDKAGMVWNADTNQMAVMLIKDGTPQVFSEQIEGAKEKITPLLPTELKTAYEKAQSAKKALEEKQKALLDVKKIVDDPIGAVTESVNKKVDSIIDDTANNVKTKMTDEVNQTLPLTEEIKTIHDKKNTLDEEQREFEKALEKESKNYNKNLQ